MPLAAMSITADMSRYFPGAFSDGPDGVGQIVLASTFATIVVAVAVAALAVWAGRKWLWGRKPS
jgi:purine-cytosine permease-like protein